ncbi:MAG: sodium:glutamate symporter, partial [Clostridia bacterium]|nr:sodium:glutamate symporter [Clostridia bacterium]
LRTTDDAQREPGSLVGVRSGAIIVSTYLVQGAIGLAISLLLAKTIKPDMFPGSGILLAMGFGQGPGQANNVGTTFEAAGMVGGRSYGLAIAACGYIVACTIGVIVLNLLRRKNKIAIREEKTGNDITVSYFQGDDELPVADSIDRLSIQIALVFVVYLLTYFLTVGLTGLLDSFGVGDSLKSILWGFNFILGSAVAIIVRICFKEGKEKNIIKKQYQNNYLLNRISGFFFDIMIICGIASINIEDLTGYLLPFVLMTVIGTIGTWAWLSYVCKKVYPEYYYEGLVAMFGMLTGTIGSGVLLLREIDPNYETPAANNLVLGSSFGVIMAIPMLILIGEAAQGYSQSLLTLILVIAYYFVLAAIALVPSFKKKKDK